MMFPVPASPDAVLRPLDHDDDWGFLLQDADRDDLEALAQFHEARACLLCVSIDRMVSHFTARPSSMAARPVFVSATSIPSTSMFYFPNGVPFWVTLFSFARRSSRSFSSRGQTQILSGRTPSSGTTTR